MDNENLKENSLKYEKLKLHIKYISGISLSLIALVIISRGYSNNVFVGEISFAATISSIILSVIAILMTIIGETKADNTKDKLVNVSEDLETITKSIGDATNKLENALNSNKELYNGFNNMQSKFEQIINPKSIEAIDETVITKINGDNEEHSCYIKIFQDASSTLFEPNYRDISLVLLYIGVKKKCGYNQISYGDFTTDMSNLGISITNQTCSWYACLIFNKALFENDVFNSFIYDEIRRKYYIEVDKIMSLLKVKEKETIN
jgi:hypothetical protein